MTRAFKIVKDPKVGFKIHIKDLPDQPKSRSTWEKAEERYKKQGMPAKEIQKYKDAWFEKQLKGKKF